MDRPLASILATNVRRLRGELGISQDELAHEARLHRTYVGAIERGERNISLASLERLATALRQTPVTLLTDGGDHA